MKVIGAVETATVKEKSMVRMERLNTKVSGKMVTFVSVGRNTMKTEN